MKSVCCECTVFFFNDTATTEIYTLSLHDALPILTVAYIPNKKLLGLSKIARICDMVGKRLQLQERIGRDIAEIMQRSEEHTSELQSRQYLVCRLLLEKKNK